MTKKISLAEAEANLDKLFNDVEAGEDIIIVLESGSSVLMHKIEDDERAFPFGFAKEYFPDMTDEEWHKIDDEFRASFDASWGLNQKPKV
jgi:hypothetical protein